VATTLYTLGYEKRSVAEFLAILRRHGIDTVIDVRDVPWSHKPGFSKAPLQRAVEDAGSEYVHAGFAGNPKWLRSAADSTEEMLDWYGWYLKEFPEVEAELHGLVEEKLEQERRVCLVCFERNPEECHRSVLASRWRARRGRRVEHIV
jgi:uncharacterized protein (DUF488 family)